MVEEKLSYLSLARHIRYLQICGLYRLDQKTVKSRKVLHNVYMRGVLSFFVLYTGQQLMKMYEGRDDLDKVMGTMFLLLTNTNCLYKMILFWKKPEQIEEIFNVLKGPIFNQGELEHKDILQETVRSALLLFRIYNHMSLFTCFLWVLHPTVLHILGRNIEFPVWLPCDYNNDPEYYMAVFYVWLQTTFLAFCNTTMDIVVTFLLEQCRTQVSILRLDLQNVVDKSKKEAETSSLSYTEILERRFKKMLVHHRLIIDTADKIISIFGGAMFYQFVVSGWTLCASAYRIVGVNPASIEFVSMIMYVMCVLIEICLYCYYGNELSYESEKLMESAYAMDWIEMPTEQQRSLLIFMERIKQPIQPMAGYIIPLSNATFISILRSSYSFYAFLKNCE